jgi:MFS family permease
MSTQPTPQPASQPILDDRERVQRRSVRVLAAAQVCGGVGVASGVAVGALLIADLGAEALSGLASASSVIGAAVIAVPVSRLMSARGRRSGLMLAYGVGATGAALVVIGAILGLLPLALVGLVLTGGGTAAGLQSRYAATDLASADRRGRALGTVVWATTVGSVLGPNVAAPMGDLADVLRIPHLAGPYLLTIASFLLAASLIALLLTPDPLLVARRIAAAESGGTPPARPRASLRAAFAQIASLRNALAGLLAMSVGHAAMVGVMSMTPVHLRHGDATLRIIGLVISVHITGMYIASPLVGMLSDRVGRHAVILGGGVLLLAALAVAGTADAHDSARLGLGLLLLGLGWSCTLVSGSALLSESVPLADRPNAQGAADLAMGIAGASGGVLAGLVVGFASYATLNLLAALLVLPMMAIVARSRAVRGAAVQGV